MKRQAESDSLASKDVYDVVVYGGTSAGVVAGVQAARMGRRVVIVEPGRHLGGLTSGGLGMTVEERLAAPLQASPEMCSLNMGSMNFNISRAGDRVKEWKHACPAIWTIFPAFWIAARLPWPLIPGGKALGASSRRWCGHGRGPPASGGHRPRPTESRDSVRDRLARNSSR